MDLRILRYFLAVADEGNITRAAERLHVSQPALSTQLAALEDELGHKLLERSARGITLTEKGVALRQRADDLVDLAERVEAEIKASDTDEIVGTVSIGAGETPAFRFVARAADELHRSNPKLCFSVSSGNGEDIVAHLREGTFDLGVLIGPGRYDGFDYLTLPYAHHWGLAVRKDSPLAAKKRISPKDARGIPLICSRQAMVKEFLAGWFGCPFGKLRGGLHRRDDPAGIRRARRVSPVRARARQRRLSRLAQERRAFPSSLRARRCHPYIRRTIRSAVASLTSPSSARPTALWDDGRASAASCATTSCRAPGRRRRPCPCRSGR